MNTFNKSDKRKTTQFDHEQITLSELLANMDIQLKNLEDQEKQLDKELGIEND